jgi:glycosyltransferase involved in cell wall biosynthesis
VRRSLIVTDSRIWTAESEYAVAVADAEAALGIEVTVATPAGSAEAVSGRRRPDGRGSDAEAGLRYMELPGADARRSLSDLFADVRFLSALTRAHRFDVVHSSGSAAHLSVALAVGRRAPLLHLRGVSRAPRTNAGNRLLYRRLTDAVIVPSARIRTWVVDALRVPPDRVHRILLPVTDDRFVEQPADGSLRRELGIRARVPVIVNVARLAPVKGHDVLLTAMVDVVRSFPDARLVLVGEPWSGQPERLRELARDLGIEEAVVFAGRRDDVPRFLAEADVCVCSSRGSEENSRAVSEYLAAGRPVVATTVGVIPELIRDGSSGLLVAPDDPAGLSRAIVSVLGDGDRATRMGDEARRTARERLSVDAFGELLSAALDAVRATGTPKGRPTGGGRG